MFGKVIVLCAPSGSGKTTLAKHLLSQTKLNLKFSISATTRQIRENETDGIDYHFMSLEDFKAKIDTKDFIEFEKVYLIYSHYQLLVSFLLMN